MAGSNAGYMRKADQTDLGAILAIEEDVHSAPWSEDQFLWEFENQRSRFLLLDTAEKQASSSVLGYVVFRLLNSHCQILNIAVAKPYQHQGWGQRLVQAVREEASRAGCEKVVLEVRRKNTAALKLYEQMGFSTTHLHSNYYSNGDDAYFMELQIASESNENNWKAP